MLQFGISVSADNIRGNVYYTIIDSVFQQPSPFCHIVMLCKIIKMFEYVTPILMKDTVSGTDQRNMLESVKVAFIFLHQELGLDFMIRGRLDLWHSYMNSAEGVISVLNLEQQNVATEQAE